MMFMRAKYLKGGGEVNDLLQWPQEEAVKGNVDSFLLSHRGYR